MYVVRNLKTIINLYQMKLIWSEDSHYILGIHDRLHHTMASSNVMYSKYIVIVEFDLIL